jgi:hypothetical protein
VDCQAVNRWAVEPLVKWAPSTRCSAPARTTVLLVLLGGLAAARAAGND